MKKIPNVTCRKSICIEFAARKAFTVMELLATMAVISILISLLLPAVQQSREAARRVACTNNLRNISLAVLNFEATHRELPCGIRSDAKDADFPWMTWQVRILPFLDQSSMWSNAVQDYRSNGSPFGINGTLPHAGFRHPLPAFHCPDDGRVERPTQVEGYGEVALTSYIGVGGVDYASKDGVLYLDSSIRMANITDGLSNTLLAGERPPSTDFRYGWWYAAAGQRFFGSPDTFMGVREQNIRARGNELCPLGPYSYSRGDVRYQCDLFHFWSLHPGGALFSRCDGSVSLISYDAANIMPALATRSGEEVFESF